MHSVRVDAMGSEFKVHDMSRANESCLGGTVGGEVGQGDCGKDRDNLCACQRASTPQLQLITVVLR